MNSLRQLSICHIRAAEQPQPDNAGPGGPENSTYAAGWGYGVVKNSPNLEGATELFKALIDKDAAVEAVKTSAWFLSARASVLEAAGGEGVAGPLEIYSAADVVALRPHHPQFVEALTIIEDTAAAFLTDQVTLEQSMAQAEEQLAQLG